MLVTVATLGKQVQFVTPIAFVLVASVPVGAAQARHPCHKRGRQMIHQS